MEHIFVNVGYAVMLLALAVRDILWLRTILICGHSCILIYALSTGNYPVVFWNTLFLIINSIRIVLLVLERRPYQIPDHLEDIYSSVFASMQRKEFLDFWHMGTLHEKSDETIVRQGQETTALCLVLSGNAAVSKSGRRLATLTRGSFFAEMGFVTGDKASADVAAEGVVGYISWETRLLKNLRQSNPDLLMKLHHSIERDLTSKIKKGSENS